jgi:methylamine---glutamate N-methyltransferase subunit C
MDTVNDTPENFRICMQGNCSTCPSFPKEPREGLYCARGPSKAAIEKRGCNCPVCPVWMDNGLSGMYYCAKLQS